LLSLSFRFFYNPFKPDYGKRMLKAQDLYADGYIHHSATFFFKDIQYFAHEVLQPNTVAGPFVPLSAHQAVWPRDLPDSQHQGGRQASADGSRPA
jgi:hypothetical protein